jgi:hypothetical protein
MVIIYKHKSYPTHDTQEGFFVYCAISRLIVLVTDQAESTHGFLRNRVSVSSFIYFGAVGDFLKRMGRCDREHRACYPQAGKSGRKTTTDFGDFFRKSHCVVLQWLIIIYTSLRSKICKLCFQSKTNNCLSFTCICSLPVGIKLSFSKSKVYFQMI